MNNTSKTYRANFYFINKTHFLKRIRCSLIVKYWELQRENVSRLIYYNSGSHFKVYKNAFN